MDLAPGSQITDSLRLVKPLGRGAMGSVWVADHLALDTQVAVKFIAAGRDDGESSGVRFAREASLAAKIGSPHVVRIFDHGLTADRTPYIVMELLGGESLAARLERSGRLGLREVGLLVSQVAEALASAHALGIVHRDIKPANLFLLKTGYELFVKVLDFGVAKQAGHGPLRELTESGAIVGTPHYMSPEMLLDSRAVDRRADLWALAVVAYRAVAGRLPFEGDSLPALAIAINEGAFEPPSVLAGGVPAELDAWFKRALCRDPELRFASADEMAKEFRLALGPAAASTAADDTHPSAPASRRPAAEPGEQTGADDGAAESQPLVGEATAAASTVTCAMQPLVGALEGRSEPAQAQGPSLPSTGSARTAHRVRPWPRAGLSAALLLVAAVAGLLLWRSAARPGATPATGAAPSLAATATAPSGASSPGSALLAPGERPASPAASPAAPADRAQGARSARRAPGAPAPSAKASSEPAAAAPASAAASAAHPLPAHCSEPFVVNERGDLV
ncbi:MAG: protein kinase, partial [Deltaproteobacteria bacterium]|nr:protein kinase [Deltaproteobacteria bacterium]